MFDFSDRLHPGEGRAFDLTSDVDVSTYTITAELFRGSDMTLITNPVVTAVDPFTRRVHVTDSMTQGQAGKRLVLKVSISDPAALNEPEIVEALLTIAPV